MFAALSIRKICLFLILLLFTARLEVLAKSEIDPNDILDQADEIYYSNPDSAYQLCRLLNSEELSKPLQAKLSMILARYYVLTTDYESTEIELQNALSIFKDLEDYAGLARAYSLNGILAERLGEYDKSRGLTLKSYQIYLEIGNVIGQVNALHNVVSEYLQIESSDSAHYYLKQLDFLKKDISGSSLYFYHQNWGRYFVLEKEYSIAEDHFFKGLDIAQKEEMVDSEATILMMIGDLYRKMNSYENAIKYAGMSYAFSDAHDLIYEKRDALSVLVETAESQLDFLSAFKYQKELSTLDAEILNIEKINNVKKVKTLLDIAEKEKIIASKDAEIAKGELETTNARFANRIFLFSLIAVALILMIVVYVFLKTRKLNQIIGDQHKDLEIKNHQISEALNDVEGSISYSKLIQDALLPGENSWSKYFNEAFMIFMPRDKVSGDFYWNYEDDKYIYLCVADCTGHGVPGAMVSVVGMNALESTVAVEQINSPAKILDRLAQKVEKTFSNDEISMKDGMDISFCRFDKSTNELVYAGANNPLYIVNAKGLEILKPDKQPIGKYEGRKPFNEQVVKLNFGDAIYLFSDGYADQFGGPKGKKFMYKSMRLIIEENRSKSMSEQKEILSKSFIDWKSGYEQVDDVCVVGLRI